MPPDQLLKAIDVGDSVSTTSSSGFISSQNTLITGGLFKQAVTVNYGHFESFGLHLLSQAIASGAMHDSSERYPLARCEADTHSEVLQEILDWTDGPLFPCNTLWVTGSPTSGRTALAQTVAEMLSESGQLAGSFFFERDNARRSTSHYLFLTLAYQIAIKVPGMREHINSAVYHDPTLPTKSSRVQLQFLILKPFRHLMDSAPTPPPISTIVIDALDECETLCAQRDILQLILTAASRSPQIPLRFVIFSSSDKQTRDIFDQIHASRVMRRIGLDPCDDDGYPAESCPPPRVPLWLDKSVSVDSSQPTSKPTSQDQHGLNNLAPRIFRDQTSSVVARRAVHGTSSPFMQPSPSTSMMDYSPYASSQSSMNISPFAGLSPRSMMDVSPPFISSDYMEVTVS